jgi:membrane protein implicated in regulation of membrane protease activity
VLAPAGRCRTIRAAMDAWVVWMIAAGALAVGEVLTLGFFLGPIAIAASMAAVVALAGGGTALQLIVFIAVSIASLGVLRPVARRHLRTPAQLRTGTAALIGQRALVLERVDATGGQVKIGGEVWSARAYDEDEVLEPGARVHVMKIDGATALVVE